ncbi:unnamed protein product [Caenorhabditis angaria]|uniref:Uncharacterized protein n=1 Tax=Caenorhabditis angaria TaxID=860376 RepID=A0A9P1IWC4_9PELO|nr:unnamed protein product [Caenorhabditis angaria]
MATTNEGVKTLIPIINEKVNQKNETQRKSVVVDVSNSTNVAQNITVNGTKLENLVDLGKNATTSAPVTEKPDKKHDPQRNSSVLEFSNSTVVSQNITENGTKTENHLKKVLDNLVDLGKNATTSAPVTTEKPNSKSETRKSTVVDVSNSTNVPLNITANGTKTENQLKKENSSVLANLVGLGVNATTSITVTTEKPNRKNETQRTSSVVAVSNGTNISQNITGNGTKAENQLKKEKPSVQKNLADLLKNSTTAAPVSTTEKPNRRSEAQRKSLVIVVPDTVNSHENEKKSLENDSKKDEEIKRIEKVAEKLELTAESLAKTQEKLKPQPRYINSKDLLKTVARAGRFSKVYPAIVVDNGNGEKDILIEDELGVRASVFLKSDLAKLIADKQISKILDHEKKNNDGLY